MRKTLAAVSFCLLLSPLAGSADTSLYSSIRLGITTTDDSDATLTSHSSRFGVRAVREIGHGNAVFGRYEWAVDASDGVISNVTASTDGNGNVSISNGEAARLSYVGFKGKWGEVQLGAIWSAYFNIAGAKGCAQFTLGCNSPMSFRLADSVGYAGRVGDLTLEGTVRLRDGVDRTQFGVGYDIQNFGVFVAIDNEDDVNDRIGLAFTYDLDNIELKALLTSDEPAQAADSEHVSLTAAYLRGHHQFIGELQTIDSDNDLNDDDILMLGYVYRGIANTRLGVALQTRDIGGDISRLYIRHDF